MAGKQYACYHVTGNRASPFPCPLPPNTAEKAGFPETTTKESLGRVDHIATISLMTNGTIHDLKAELVAAESDLNQAVRALAPKHVGGEMEAYEVAYQRLLGVERRLAEAESRPYAVLCECPITWDIGAPLPSLLQSDRTTLLFFLLSDDDARVGRIEFENLSSTLFGAPNDEIFAGHPLHGSGFEPYRLMEVINSPWIQQLEKMNSVHPYHKASAYADTKHFIFPFHDTTFECVAKSFTASTISGRLADVVRDAVALLY